MITLVKTLTPVDEYEGAAIRVKCVYDDSNKRIEQRVTVKRFVGADSCSNVNGTNGKIEVRGDITFVEDKDGKMELSQESEWTLKDSIAVFKAMFGESEQET